MAEQRAEPLLRAGIRELVFPRSIAIVGASPRRPEPVTNLARGDAAVWGVNPGRTEVDSVPCFPTVADLPESPEVAVLVVGHVRIEEAFEEAAAAGVRAFVVPGLGNEAGADGRVIASRLARRAEILGASVLGPNCMGVAVPDGASSWLGTLRETFAGGHVAVISQSGSIGEALTALGPRVGFRCVVSSGAEAVRDAADFLAFFANDDATRVIGLFVEQVRRPQAFAAALALAAEAGKPVVCLKVGRSQAGARAALAHTGAIVGSDRAFSALLYTHGAIEVDDYPQLVETLEVLGRSRRPRGLRVAAISESGGEGALLADHGEEAGMPFAPLSDALAADLKREFPNYLEPGNPVDAWAVDNVERVYPRSLELLAGSGEFDVLLAQIDLSQFRGATENDWCLLVVNALADAVEETGIFPAVTSVQTADPPPAIAAAARERDIALLRGSRNATRALAAAARWHPRLPVTPARHAAIDVSDVLRPGALSEYESGCVLERYGIPLAPRRRASSADEAAAGAAELGFPVVVKADGIPHKSARGGVVVGLASREAVARAAEELGPRVLVARQVPPGLEAFCGVTRDPDFGPVLAVGLGGAAVEACPSPAVALAPIEPASARALVDGARGLAGAGEQARDTLASVLVALGRLAVDHPEVEAVDVNPIVVSGDDAVGVDALVVVNGGGTE